MNVRKEALTFAYIINLEQKNLHKIYEAPQITNIFIFPQVSWRIRLPTNYLPSHVIRMQIWLPH